MRPARCYVAVNINVILLTIVVGLASAVFALLFIIAMNCIERGCKRLGIAAPIASGVALAVLVFFFPEAKALAMKQ